MIGVLFICMGNICRSPMAEGIFRARLEASGLSKQDRALIQIDSAGTLGYHADSPPDRRAIALAKSRGIDISGQRARKVSAQDFKRFDYLLAMDRDNLHILQDMAPEGLSHRASLILSFAPDVALDEVPDPYYGGEQGFLRCYQLIDEAAAGFLDHLIAHHFPKHL
ncbi:protein-tyrosine-phosphatase [Iodidimonas nitroreducens]|uniref:protein-tyrosine-phosphatase n=1 Tax=Iodidimonas nitroreducens TaxID=1236968 RepID=A0A5A7N956_9PROT|nr:low molecular weight protein-tyrosine-phosphatase [Iodidimonas nitroreducens]GAK33504.1 low molecular weight phosphotyrosine protein phosphatase [alpha proteobacterium Q-1]GER04447.1 protein-tyrosine-phosphatase [Iodidimonas nitroreducens]